MRNPALVRRAHGVGERDRECEQAIEPHATLGIQIDSVLPSTSSIVRKAVPSASSTE